MWATFWWNISQSLDGAVAGNGAGVKVLAFSALEIVAVPRVKLSASANGANMRLVILEKLRVIIAPRGSKNYLLYLLVATLEKGFGCGFKTKLIKCFLRENLDRKIAVYLLCHRSI